MAGQADFPEGYVPEGVLNGFSSGHALWISNPRMARRLEDAVRNYVLPRTRACYASAVRGYVRFVNAHNVGPPFPLDPVMVSAWIIYAADDISVQSIKSYLSALKYEHISRGCPWNLGGNEYMCVAQFGTSPGSMVLLQSQ